MDFLNDSQYWAFFHLCFLAIWISPSVKSLQAFWQFLKIVSVYFLVYFWLCWVLVAAHRLSLVVVSKGYSLVVVHGLLSAVASLVAEHGLEGTQTSVVAVCVLSNCGEWLSCPLACKIFLDQGSNPSPLHWQVNFQQLEY